MSIDFLHKIARGWATALTLLVLASGAGMARAEPAPARITSLYDAFGKPSAMVKDWGYSALIEYGGKRILFDTGNNAEIFAHNIAAKGVDLADLDFVIVSHRHGDHTSGLNYLLQVNPDVPIYVPKENFGVFGAALPGSFYPRDEALPPDMRYFDGSPPERLHFGSPWPDANFNWITETTEIAPGFHLIMQKGTWGVDLDAMEISLAIDTPEGIVLVVGCSHPTLERIVEAVSALSDKPIRLVIGGTHLLPAKQPEIERIATALLERYHVQWIAPVHCTGEPAFEILNKRFGSRYLYAGLGSVIEIGHDVKASDDGSSKPDAEAADPT